MSRIPTEAKQAFKFAKDHGISEREFACQLLNGIYYMTDEDDGDVYIPVPVSVIPNKDGTNKWYFTLDQQNEVLDLWITCLPSFNPCHSNFHPFGCQCFNKYNSHQELMRSLD